MDKAFLLLRGVSARNLFKANTSVAEIEQILYVNSVQLKQLTVHLVKLGVPLRHILLPYADTVLLQDSTASYFFGERVLVQAENATELYNAVCLLQKETPEAYNMVHAYAAQDRAQLNALLTRRAFPVTKRCSFFSSTDTTEPRQLVHYTFESGRVVTLPHYETDCRCAARAVLAFGDILGRVVQKNGGRVLRCAEHELICAWPQQEPTAMVDTLQQTYADRLLPTLGGKSVMNRAVYTTEGKP